MNQIMKLFITFLFLFVLNINLFAQEMIIPEGRGNNVITELFFAGLKDKMAENYVNASKNFTKIIALDGKNDAAYFELANISYRQNKLLDAEIDIKKAIEINSNNIWYLKLQAEIYKRNGNMNALLAVFDQLIKLSPDDISLYFDKANAFTIEEKTEEAQKISYLIYSFS